MFHIPTYDECKRICESTNNLFYETKTKIDGYDISIFNYRLTTFDDFKLHKAFELRGITFVFNEDGSLFKCYPVMEKFFNLNENDSCKFDSLKYKKIKSVYSKEDGSVISFVQLPNGKIKAKSKMSFESDQAKQAQSLFDSYTHINKYVSGCLQCELVPIFELVGPKNQVVVKYESTKLILLRLRDRISGNYLPLDEVNFEKPESFKFTLTDLISLKSNLEGFEGWVVEFIDGQKVKIKTDWYLSLHKIMTDYSNREDYLIDLIIDEKIDDLLSMLDSNTESRIFVEEVIRKTTNKIGIIHKEIDKLLSNFDGDKKSFALKHSDNPLFGILMKTIGGQNKDLLVKEYIRKKTYRLHQAREWLSW